jgi:putative membrane protein
MLLRRKYHYDTQPNAGEKGEALMPQSDEQTGDVTGVDGGLQAPEKAPSEGKPHVSGKVTDHLANERTFLAWIRTGLATITFGFVVERFGLLLRELGFKSATIVIPAHYSTFFGVSLTILGVVMMVVALLNFLQVRRAIDQATFQPRAWYAIVLTILASMVGLLLAIYLFLTG